MSTITGRAATIKWGYHTVASLGSWTCTPGTMTATLLSCDAFGITQDPLTVHVPAGPRVWRWAVESLSRDGLTVTMQIRPEE